MSSSGPSIEADPANTKAKRTNVACLKCRERKVRCSGLRPCTNCVRRGADCIFESEERKILVSESYLNELKRKRENDEDVHRQLRRRQDTLSDHTADVGSSATPVANPVVMSEPRTHASEDDDLPPMTNPLVSTPSKYITDQQGRKRFLGPSSTWAYSRHVMSMLRQFLDHSESPELPLNIDGAAFALELPSTKQLGSRISMDSLPSLDYALYLINTVKFHIGQTYHLFEERSLMQGLYALYSDGPQPLTAKNRLWYVQYFLTMAMGKALLARGTSKSNPPGSEYFTRAMELFPEVNGLYHDSILSVEVCCSLALYLQSVDHRNSAYVYLGIGLRIALSQGFHRDLASEIDANADTCRFRSAWWTLYILDRKFSSLIGAPTSINDNDISVPLPRSQHLTQSSGALDMHVRLSRLLAKVINTVYGIDGRLDSSFLKHVQVTLRELAGLAQELNAAFEVKLDNNGPISRVSATLNLCYHQCIDLATRPLLVCILRDKLEKRSRREINGPVKALLKTSSDSATKTLRILTLLQNQDLLGFFLPFDLNHAFSAGFVLSLMSTVMPLHDGIDNTYLDTTFAILDALIAGGNLPAHHRRQELDCLQHMLHSLAQKNDVIEQQQQQQHPQSMDGTNEISTEMSHIYAHGASPNQMLSVARLLEGFPAFEVGTGAIDNWLWAEGSLDNMQLPDLFENT